MQNGWRDILINENSTGKMYIRGFSKSGNAILYMRPKYENTKDHNGNMKHLVYHMERAIAVMNKQEKGVEKIVLLIDYDGYSIFNAPPMKTSMETLSILQNHYPEVSLQNIHKNQIILFLSIFIDTCKGILH